MNYHINSKHEYGKQIFSNIKLTKIFLDTDDGDVSLTLRLLMSYIYGAPSKARNANVVYIWTYVWQR